jgi:hypothetical protein
MGPNDVQQQPNPPYWGNEDYPARDPIDMRTLIPDGGDLTATNSSNVSVDDYQLHSPNTDFEVRRHDEAYLDPNL